MKKNPEIPKTHPNAAPSAHPAAKPGKPAEQRQGLHRVTGKLGDLRGRIPLLRKGEKEKNAGAQSSAVKNPEAVKAKSGNNAVEQTWDILRRVLRPAGAVGAAALAFLAARKFTKKKEGTAPEKKAA